VPAELAWNAGEAATKDPPQAPRKPPLETVDQASRAVARQGEEGQPRHVDHGVPALAAASVVGVVGLASVAGKTGWGMLSDRFGRELAYTLAFACVLTSVGALTVTGAPPNPVLPYVYAVLIGLG
jgi:MFS family permease